MRKNARQCIRGGRLVILGPGRSRIDVRLKRNGDFLKTGLEIEDAFFRLSLVVVIDPVAQENERLDRVLYQRPHGGREFEDLGRGVSPGH
jgi:hypothetical protein